MALFWLFFCELNPFFCDHDDVEMSSFDGSLIPPWSDRIVSISPKGISDNG